jgi:hypothetical protein
MVRCGEDYARGDGEHRLVLDSNIQHSNGRKNGELGWPLSGQSRERWHSQGWSFDPWKFIPTYGVGAMGVGGNPKARLRIPDAVSAVVATTGPETRNSRGSAPDADYSLLDAEAARTLSWC